MKTSLWSIWTARIAFISTLLSVLLIGATGYLHNASTVIHPSQIQALWIVDVVLGTLLAAAAGWVVRRAHAGRGLAERACRDGEASLQVLLNEVEDYAVFTLDTQGTVVS
ncbi:MAG: hypothetical protein QOJ54_2794, partial [Aliidongia sp.]|nr:hypothetical protein [Aliidongia sp.]